MRRPAGTPIGPGVPARFVLLTEAAHADTLQLAFTFREHGG